MRRKVLPPAGFAGRLFTMLALVVSISTIGHAKTFIVDKNHPSANDANPGTISSPWLTIRKAAQTMIAGDTVYVRNGVYNEQVLTTADGAAGVGRIVFTAYPGEKPVVNGQGVTSGNNGVIISHSYITFSGFEVRNWPHAGIWMQTSGYVEIADCEVHDVQGGVSATGAHDFTVSRVLMFAFLSYGFDASPDGGDCYNGTINDCIARNARDRQQNVDGFALGHGNQSNFVFNRCITYEVYDGFDISSRQTTLNRCASYNTWNGSYKIWQDDVTLVNCFGYNAIVSVLELDWDNEPGKTTLINCTFYKGQSYTINVESASDTLHMYNCIVAGGENIGLLLAERSTVNYSGDYNLFHNTNPFRAIVVGFMDEFPLDSVAQGAWTAYSGQDAHSVVVTSGASIFMNPANGDFQLQKSSPAVDKGTATGAPSEDYLGKRRPDGNGYDIGAFEYQFSTDVPTEQTVPGRVILDFCYPNPVRPDDLPSNISYSMKEDDFLMLQIFDIQGNRIRNLVSEHKRAGRYLVQWDGKNDLGIRVPSGTYFARLRTGHISQTKRLLLLR